MKRQWYVITGGPGAGKTTVVNHLKDKGYTVVEEVARKYYEKKMAEGFTNEEIRMDDSRQVSISAMQIEIESMLNPYGEFFFDRALPDGAGYFEFLKTPMPDFVEDAYKKSTYGKVFFLEQLPYVQDKIRTESNEEAIEIARIIYSKYKDVNAKIIMVPVMDRKARVQFILDNL